MEPKIQYINDIDKIEGKRIFIRVDFNVPQDSNGQITCDFRIKAAVPTIRYALNQKAKVIIGSHLGRPSEKTELQYSLKPVSMHLGDLLNQRVHFAPDCIGKSVANQISALKNAEVIMLENLHYYEADLINDWDFAAQLGALADVFVNDAFARIHRTDASIVGITDHMDVNVGGLLMRDEIAKIHRIISSPDRPFLGLLGGNKINKKLKSIKHIIQKFDEIIIGGAMAFPFLKLAGIRIASPIMNEESIELANQCMINAKRFHVNIHLPDDVVVIKKDKKMSQKIISTNDIIPDFIVKDIGPKTMRKIQHHIRKSTSIFWNGPMGVFESSEFAAGSMETAHSLGESKAHVLVGGGETSFVLCMAQEEENVDFLSTGGIALLNFIEGIKLPGILALQGL